MVIKKHTGAQFHNYNTLGSKPITGCVDLVCGALPLRKQEQTTEHKFD